MLANPLLRSRQVRKSFNELEVARLLMDELICDT